MIGIITLSIVPMRADQSERSEMISQLLFGEEVEVLKVSPPWLKVKNVSDGYEGWVDIKMVDLIAADGFNSDKRILAKPFITAIKACDRQKMILSAGSVIGPISDNRFKLGSDWYELSDNSDLFLPRYSKPNLIAVAIQFLNTPYLWGGKSIFGVDCSGLVQLAYSICGVQLPRDASQQIAVGEPIDSLDNVQEGDLAFFSNSEGDVTHVGILLSNTEIIHASGCVKIDRIDKQGIISSITGEYLYSLHAIRRVKD